jgi:hypothetical protein
MELSYPVRLFYVNGREYEEIPFSELMGLLGVERMATGWRIKLTLCKGDRQSSATFNTLLPLSEEPPGLGKQVTLFSQNENTKMAFLSHNGHKLSAQFNPSEFSLLDGNDVQPIKPVFDLAKAELKGPTH